MEALIQMKWEDLEAFSNQHYKYLIHPQFYMKLADRIYELPTQEEQDEAAAKATKIWNRLLKVLEAAETARTSTAEMLEKVRRHEEGAGYGVGWGGTGYTAMLLRLGGFFFLLSFPLCTVFSHLYLPPKKTHRSLPKLQRTTVLSSSPWHPSVWRPYVRKC